MFETIIEYDKEKARKGKYSIDQINEYLDSLYLDNPDIIKKSEGHYVGITDSDTEFAHIGRPIITLSKQKWFREIVTRWELWENGEIEENIIETLEKREAQDV